MYRGKTLPQKSFHLSFDDGFRECHDIIAPILIRHGVQATFFICSAFLDNRNMFFRNKISLLIDQFSNTLTKIQDQTIRTLFTTQGLTYRSFPQAISQISSARAELVDTVAEILDFDFANYLNQKKPYLSSEQVDTLIAKGFTVGGHSVDHALYRNLSFDEQLRQTRECMANLSSRFSISCKAFAFPHTDTGVTQVFFRNAAKNIDIFFGTSRMKKDNNPFVLQRFSLEDSRFSCAEIVKGNLLRQACYDIIGKGTIRRE
jgi:peptidoglycan/xylan/chitin deacetylase (PgdA/CDA1 family)